MDMIKKILIALCVFVFLIGAGVFLYPSFRTAAQKQTAQAEIQRFENAIQKQNEQAEAGMEERIFPIARAIQSMKDSDIEEERRLCYVGITRAKEELIATN